jgi:hypothetical protein
MDNSNTTAHGEELPQPLLETISLVLGLKLEGVQPFLANDPAQVAQLTEMIRETSRKRHVQSSRLMTSAVIAPDEQIHLQPDPSISSERVMLNPKKAKISEIGMESRNYHTQDPPEDPQPTFIYSYMMETNQLFRTSLVTGEQSSYRVPSYTFIEGRCWSEVPGGSLLITGGVFPAVREVVRIDIRRDFAVSHCPPMLTPRAGHAAVYHTQHLYVIGGLDDCDCLSECERYACAENRWEALPPLPKDCCNTSGVVVESSLYALGGSNGSLLDVVQRLSLESLTWELLQLRLPHSGCSLTCFKLSDTEVYLVINKTLYSFTGQQVRPLKTLTTDICTWNGASYYRRGTVYCSNSVGAARSHEIGSLTSD